MICSACETRAATVSTGPTWFLCDDCEALSAAYDLRHGLPHAKAQPITYEYRCHRVTEADGDEDGFVNVRCGFNAAVVSINYDQGLCLDCLRELALDDVKPLPILDPLVRA